VTRDTSCGVFNPADGPDADAIGRVLGGDVEAFAILVDRHRDRMFRFAVRMLGNREDAEDAVQEAFVRAFRALANCEDRARFDGWLFRILVNRCRTRGARRRRYDAAFVADPVALDRAVAPVTALPADGHDAGVAAALASLPAEQREAFLLKYVEELSYEEMAAATGAGVSALKMRVKRAGARLRELLAEKEGTHVG
jgi:RNA polymerase sigma-70 factor, ECF subfamily